MNKFAPTRTRQRGFTLVEIAIAIGVVGLLLAASAWTARALEERRQIEREMQRLEIVRDAIVGYAIRSRTRERILKVVPWFGPGGEWEFRLPAGRPYLPCPDFDGDGYEDRVPLWAFPQGVEVKPDLTVTVTVGELAPPENGSLTWTQDSESNPATHPYGECRVSRGTVPWRTLGVAPSDGWGNRHTYFADPVFSNAIFGFDRQTVADIYDPRVPSAPGYGASPRYFRDVFGDILGRDILNAPPTHRFIYVTDDNRGCPAAICIGNSACELTSTTGSSSRWHPIFSSSTVRIVRRCTWQNTRATRYRFTPSPTRVTTVFKAGLVTPTAVPDGRKPYPAGSVIDGLPFVLVSHGPNGRHAVNHWATLRNRIRGHGGFFFPICNPPLQSDLEFADRTRFLDLAENRIQNHEVVNRACLTSPDLTISPCVYISGFSIISTEIWTACFSAASFAWRPPGINNDGDFDDLLLWGTRGELSAWVPGNIPLLPPMVMAYFGPEFPPN